MPFGVVGADRPGEPANPFGDHFHFVRDDQGLTDRVRAATIGGIAIFAVEAHVERMGICSRPGCERAYVGTSRAGRRAYCTAVCGNTHAVQRYRERKRPGAERP